MTKTRSTRQYRLAPEDWIQAVMVYELGHKNGRELADLFGVSPQAMTKGLRDRGAIKGCRAFETTVELERCLAARQVRRDKRMLADIERRREVIEVMMEALIAADRADSLHELAPLIEKIRRTI